MQFNIIPSNNPQCRFCHTEQACKTNAKWCFIYTSNVDGQFQKAGFSEMQIVECHGSIHHLQCLDGCMNDVWSADDFYPETDDVACQLISPLPLCPHCGKVSRPSIYMFNDMGWINNRKITQQARLDQWLNKVERLLVIEIGAGTRISTARDFSERQGGFLIRINPNESKIPSHVNGISLPMGGLAGLQLLADILKL